MSGGIWILWNNPSLSITVKQSKKQYVHCMLSGMTEKSWCFTAIYASPREMERREMWQELESIAAQTKALWLVASDFNDVMDQSEQRGRGGEVDERKCRRFRDNIQKCNLIDLGT